MPKFLMFFTNKNSGKNKKKSIIISIIIMIIFFINIMLKTVMPTFENLCNVKAKSIAIKTFNYVASDTMKNIGYDDLMSYTKDVNGNITMLKSNVTKMNSIAVDISSKIQEELSKLDKETVSIPIGALTGNQLLAGTGPNIKIKVIPFGSTEISFKSEFESSRN